MGDAIRDSLMTRRGNREKIMSTQITISQLFGYLHRRIVAELTNQNEEELNYLGTTVRVLFEAAEHENDAELYTLLDDMNYLLNENLMGAPAKGETVLPSISAKLKQLDERDKLRIRNEQPETGS